MVFSQLYFTAVSRPLCSRVFEFGIGKDKCCQLTVVFVLPFSVLFSAEHTNTFIQSCFLSLASSLDIDKNPVQKELNVMYVCEI